MNKGKIEDVESIPEVVGGDLCRGVDVLRAAQWEVGAWKHGVRPLMLVQCFSVVVRLFGSIRNQGAEDNNTVESRI